ncbi:hypothetical protein, partial [Pseudoalteromonas sp.]|uniref:hypothetical protein n=1 Tax=Pseudoalteromonas sp. TaxID=53249 RepID=UPI003567E06B
MLTLNVVNLVQAGIVCTGALGAFVLWQNKPKEFRGIAIFLLLSAFASLINILEESGLTRDIYLISPIFILLFGPASYLATKLLLNKALNRYYWLHLLPVIP